MAWRFAGVGRGQGIIGSVYLTVQVYNAFQKSQHPLIPYTDLHAKGREIHKHKHISHFACIKEKWFQRDSHNFPHYEILILIGEVRVLIEEELVMFHFNERFDKNTRVSFVGLRQCSEISSTSQMVKYKLV
jgi:hypothetical protein